MQQMVHNGAHLQPTAQMDVCLNVVCLMPSNGECRNFWVNSKLEIPFYNQVRLIDRRVKPIISVLRDTSLEGLGVFYGSVGIKGTATQ